MTAMRLFLLAACACVSATQLRAQTTTIDNVTIVDVTNGRLQPQKTIVIEGNRIARVDDASVATRAAATLDGTGMFVIPRSVGHAHSCLLHQRHRAFSQHE